QKSNVVLSDSKERVYSMDEGVEEIPLGLYLVKGDMIILIGELDEERDSSIDLSTIRADPDPPHPLLGTNNRRSFAQHTVSRGPIFFQPNFTIDSALICH
ncbi:hypothetical protein H4582DRAFT_1828442, partial [Lactarius indigo]